MHREWNRETYPLKVRFELRKSVVLNSLRQAPAETREEHGLGSLQRFASQNHVSAPFFRRTRAIHDLPFFRLADMDMLLNAHHLDMVEVFGRAAHDLAQRVHLALLKHPRLRPLDHALRGPSGQRAGLEDEASSEKRARGRELARYDVAGEDMGRVGVRVS